MKKKSPVFKRTIEQRKNISISKLDSKNGMFFEVWTERELELMGE